MDAPSPPDTDLARLREAGASRGEVLGALLEAHRKRLLRMVDLRMDPALRARLGASDVLQEAYIEIAERLDKYLDDPPMPFFVWVRFLTAQRLLQLRRYHVGAKRRDARRERHAEHLGLSGHSTVALADRLMATGITPSVALMREDRRARVVRVLEGLKEEDREILALRHFEELTNIEAAQVLGIGADASSKRYIRALERLRKGLDSETENPGASPA